MTQSTLKLKADFIKDFINHTKKLMASDGYDVSLIPDETTLMYFHNTILKKPPPKVRELHVSDAFLCPADLQNGWKILGDKVTNGEDFPPHLSKKISDALSHDSLLNDWSVYHFHLGNKVDPKSGFIERTGPLLFALVTDSAFYAINVYAHGQWAESDIIETVHKNWPETIKHAKINGLDVTNVPTPKERIELRKNNINAPFKTSDGTIYSIIGGGSATSGMGIRAVHWSNKQHYAFSDIQNELKAQLPEILKQFKKYSRETEINASLIFTETGMRVLFPQFGEYVDLK